MLQVMPTKVRATVSLNVSVEFDLQGNPHPPDEIMGAIIDAAERILMDPERRFRIHYTAIDAKWGH